MNKRGVRYLMESKKKSLNLTPYLFIGPHLVLFLMFFLVPAIFGIYISFTNWNLVNAPTFVGFDNFREILLNTESTFHNQFFTGLGNTFKFALFTVPFLIIIPLMYAIALNTKIRGMKLFQSIFYLPSLFSISAVIIIWATMFNRTFGPINQIFRMDVNWVGAQPYAWIALIIVTVWWTIGTNMIIYQAALNGVPKDYYEAASLDGANKIHLFRYITLPGIKSQILYTLVITTIAQLNVFGQPLMLTSGGPNQSTAVLLMFIQGNAFGSGPSIAGIASAQAIMLGLCIMAVSVLQFRLMKNNN